MKTQDEDFIFRFDVFRESGKVNMFDQRNAQAQKRWGDALQDALGSARSLGVTWHMWGIATDEMS